MTVFYCKPVLESELAAWLALGWREAARDRRPSVAEDIVLLVYDGDEEPVVGEEGT